MPATVATYYIDELGDWEHSIDYYAGEATEIEAKLSEIIQRNSIPHIAEQVEEQLEKLEQVMEKFRRVLNRIQEQRVALQTDSSLIDDELLNNETDQKQVMLRRYMQQTEKEYIDSKYACSDFLSKTLKKKHG